MATGTTSVSVGIGQAAAIGSGEGAGDLLLCSITMGASERGARVRGTAWSSDGQRLAVDAVAAIDPESGELLLAGHSALSVVVDQANRIDFTVAGSTGVTWRGYLEVELVYDYSV